MKLKDINPKKMPNRLWVEFTEGDMTVGVIFNWRQGEALVSLAAELFNGELPPIESAAIDDLTAWIGIAQKEAELCYAQWQKDRAEKKEASRAAFEGRAS